MKGSIDTTAFGWLWPGIPNHAHTRHTRLDLRHRRKKREREGEGKMLGRHFIWLKEDLQVVRENISDDGHCKIIGIRKVCRFISEPTKPNGVKFHYSSLLHAIIAQCPLSKYFAILCIFAQIFKYFPLFQHFLACFLKNQNSFPLLSRIGPGCIY